MSSGYGPDRDVYKRPSRAKFEPKPDPVREHRPLTDTERAEAMATLQTWRVQGRYLDPDGGHWEWICEVWAELVNPSACVERVADLRPRIRLAIFRAEQHLRKLHRECVMPLNDLETLEGARRVNRRTKTLREIEDEKVEDDSSAASGP
jgi:hypothetical protein